MLLNGRMQRKGEKMPIKFYEELEIVINEWWDSLPEETKKDINKLYDKYYKLEPEVRRLN
jgi:hypothetical protein